MIISIDFDNTLAMGNKSHIAMLTPNVELIKRLNAVQGYKKIVTARGAKYGLDTEAKRKLYLKPMQEWLERYGVEYNEISFNKEYAHLYIDDMTIPHYEEFNQVPSKFTGNQIIQTEHTFIKHCSTALYEAEWYKMARTEGLVVPNVLFVNDELIITDRIKPINKPHTWDMTAIIDKFKEIPSKQSIPFHTYVDNLKDFDRKLPEQAPTFFHGDLSTTNVLVSEGCIYLIDPNYKGIFGNYMTDAGKAAWSFAVYENDIESAQKIVDAYGPEVWLFAAAEGSRVCKYKPEYFRQVKLILDICEPA